MAVRDKFHRRPVKSTARDVSLDIRVTSFFFYIAVTRSSRRKHLRFGHNSQMRRNERRI